MKTKSFKLKLSPIESARRSGYILLQSMFLICLLSLSCKAFSDDGKRGESTLLAPLGAMIDDYLRADQDVNLDLFVMSQCPFGVEAEKELVPLVKEYNGRVNFNLFFIAVEKDGKIRSMHGDAEVEEDMRQMVISKLYPGKLLDYLVARGQNGAKGDWVKTAEQLGMDVNEVRAELLKPATKKAFKNNIQRCLTDGISQSPYLLVNRRHYEGALLAFAGNEGGCRNEVIAENVIVDPEPYIPPVGDSAVCGTQMYSKKNQDCLLCNGNKTVVAKGTDCCTGVAYDHACFRCEDGNIVGKCPPGHICCDGNCSINNTQICLSCGTKKVLVEPHFKCCGNGQIYNSKDSDCVQCGSVYVVLPKGQQCCNGVPYDSKVKDCITCNGNQVLVPKGNVCCQNGQNYNPKDSTCIQCGSSYFVVLKGTECCNNLPFNNKTQDCIQCNGQTIVVPKGNVCCQNGQVYNPKDSDCVKCGSVYTVVPKGQTNCCNGQPIDFRTQDCIICNGLPVVVPKGYQCCNGLIYDPKTKDCLQCLGNITIVPKGTQCCLNGQTYDPTLQDCIKCGTSYVIVPKGGDCCFGTPYDKKCFRCEDGHVVSKCPPGHLCCDGNCGTKDEFICTTTRTVVTCTGSTTTTTPFTCSNSYIPPPCQTTGQLTYSHGVCIGGTVVTICYSGPVHSICP